jgi:hypothetical protein
MNVRKSLALLAFVLAACIGVVSGHWLAAGALYLAVEGIMAMPQARCGVNTLGTLATATIVQEALALVFTKRPILKNISMGFTEKDGSPISAFNQQVITRTLGLPTVQNFGSAASATADVDVPVTLDQFKELRYEFTPQEYSGTNRDLVRERAEPMAIALGNSMVDAIAALWTTANFTNPRAGADAVANGATVNVTVQAGGQDYTHLVNQRGILNKAGVPDYKRFYVGNSDVYGSMLNDQRIVAYLNNQRNGDAIMRGELPDVAGFGLAEYPALTAKAGGNLIAVCGSPDSTVYAARVPKNPTEVIPGLPIPGRIGYVTEPKTGFTVMVLEYVTMSTLVVSTVLVWMYGVAKGNINNLQLIKSQ